MIIAANAAIATNTAVSANVASATKAPAGTNATVATRTNAAVAAAAVKPKFTKQQIVGRLKELKRLYEEGLIIDNFYHEKVAECEAAQ